MPSQITRQIASAPSERIAAAWTWTYRGLDCAILLRNRPVPEEWHHELVEDEGLVPGHTYLYVRTVPDEENFSFRPVPGGYTGYVRKPDLDFGEYLHHAPVSGGVTYAVDEDGWVGFDTNHGGDVHVDCDGNWTEGSQYYYTRPYEGGPNIWTPQAVADEVVRLADFLLD